MDLGHIPQCCQRLDLPPLFPRSPMALCVVWESPTVGPDLACACFDSASTTDSQQ
jgi:hypothetical protein